LVGNESYVFVAQRLASADSREPVDGWTKLGELKPLSPAEAKAYGGSVPLAVASEGAPAPDASPTPPAKAPVAAATPVAAAAPPSTAVAAQPDDLLRFDQPVPFGPFPVNGRSLKSLLGLTNEPSFPMFPPIEGLEDSLWKKACPTCHKWNEARLCEQGKSYLKTPRYALRQPHPFGGADKIALMRWAKGGCQ
jgi:hypothetical protein